MADQDQTQARYWVPSRTYDFQLKIGKKDYTNDLYKLTILTSIETPYQTFIVDMFLDPNDIILEEIYGQTPLKLTVRFLGPVVGTIPNTELERISFDLMVVSSDFSAPQAEVINSDAAATPGHKDRRPFTITAVSRNSYKTMNTIVNGVYFGQSVASVIRSLVNTNLRGITLEYDTIGRNNEPIEQVLVPPTTIYKAIRYLNKLFGIYNGIYTTYCDYNNVLYIKNMSSRIKTTHAFTIWHLATNVDSRDVIEKEDEKTTIYYTWEDVQTSYSGNSIFSSLAPVNRFIVTPRDRLSETIDVNLEEFGGQYGLISKGKKMYFDSEAIDDTTRIAYYKDHTGYETTDSFINANLSKILAEMSTLTINVYQYMYIEPLLKVGEAVQIHSKVTNMQQLTGKYILKGSEIIFSRVKDWESAARLYLIRTNRTD